MAYRPSKIARRDDVNKRRDRRALRAPRRKVQPRGKVLKVTVNLVEVRKQLEHCRAMVARDLTTDPARMTDNAIRHARAAHRLWMHLHVAAIRGSRSAQEAVQTLCAEFGLVSVLNLEQYRVEM